MKARPATIIFKKVISKFYVKILRYPEHYNSWKYLIAYYKARLALHEAGQPITFSFPDFQLCEN